MFFTTNDGSNVVDLSQTSFQNENKIQPVPDGMYNVVIEKAEVRKQETPSPKLYVRYVITDGEYEGRAVGESMNVFGKCVWDSHVSKLKSLCKACGLVDGGTPEDLVGRHLRIFTGIKESRDGEGVFNYVDQFLPSLPQQMRSMQRFTLPRSSFPATPQPQPQNSPF